MLRISKLADYASIVMVCFAKQPESLLSAKELATQTRLGLPTVSKLLKLLANYGLLRSVRGALGGYTLARGADVISVKEIMHAIDGNEGLTQCSEHDDVHTCTLADVCGLSTNWKLISRAVMSALDGIKLSQLAQSMLSEVHIDVSAITNIANHPNDQRLSQERLMND